jgi:hypothetical protein
MNSLASNLSVTCFRWFPASRVLLGFALIFALGLGPVVRGCGPRHGFATPEDAVGALVAAATAHDTNALRQLFGPAGEELVNSDRVQAENELQAFVEACRREQRIVRSSDTRCLLVIGDEAWPFPVPLVNREGRWFFDTESGKDELLSRRIGRNELSTLQVVRAYVDAQREYAAKDRDGDEVLEYAQRFLSSPGRKDGLHWPPELDGDISPLGPLVAQAQAEGYALGRKGIPSRSPTRAIFSAYSIGKPPLRPEAGTITWSTAT